MAQKPIGALNSTIKQLLRGDSLGTKVVVKGWVRSIRKQKNICFANVSDGTTLPGIQAILKEDQTHK
jgi:asparaginyl-tRNA synthetase